MRHMGTISASLALALVGGVVPLTAGPAAAAEWPVPCTVDSSASWLPTGGRLELSIGGCAFRVTSALDPYDIIVTGPDDYAQTVYQGNGTAPTGNVVLDNLSAGTYTVTSWGVVGTESNGGPAYRGVYFYNDVSPASDEVSPATSANPAPPAYAGPALRVTRATPGKGSKNVWRESWLKVKFSTDAYYMRGDIAVTLTDLTTGRNLRIGTSYCYKTWTMTIDPAARLAANHGYRISVTSAGSNLKFRSTFRTGSR
jgi:Big-like domain-containing protein